MDRLPLFDKRVFFLALFAGILLIGFLIPSFYDWSGANQSRPSPQVGQVFKFVVGFIILVLVALPWLPLKITARNSLSGDSPESESSAHPYQFSVRMLLVAMSAVAIMIVAVMNYLLGTIVLLIAAAFVFLMWMVAHHLSLRWQIGALLACMYCPWFWVFFDSDFNDGELQMFFAIFGLPSFTPSLLVSRFALGHRLEEVAWILFVLTAIEFAIGVLLIRLGPKRAIAYLMLALFCSLLGSFSLNALMRI